MSRDFCDDMTGRSECSIKSRNGVHAKAESESAQTIVMENVSADWQEIYRNNKRPACPAVKRRHPDLLVPLERVSFCHNLKSRSLEVGAVPCKIRPRRTGLHGNGNLQLKL